MEKIKVCAKKFSVWAKSAAGIISICLFIVSLILLGLGCSTWGNLSERDANNINNILFGLGTNLIGIIVTVSFVQYFLDRQNEKEARQCELRKILFFDRAMQILIQNYIIYFNMITTPSDSPNGISDSEMNQKISFADLKDLYHQSLLIRDRGYKPAIEAFYEAEAELQKNCREVASQIDFKYYPDILNDMTQFAETSLRYNVRDVILGNIQMRLGERKCIDVVKEYIADETHDWVKALHEGKISGNIMTPYVLLFDMLNCEKACIESYQAHIASLKKEKL